MSKINKPKVNFETRWFDKRKTFNLNLIIKSLFNQALKIAKSCRMQHD